MPNINDPFNIRHNNANANGFNWAYKEYLNNPTFENYQMAKFYLQGLERSPETQSKYTQVMKRFFDRETPPSTNAYW